MMLMSDIDYVNLLELMLMSERVDIDYVNE